MVRLPSTGNTHQGGAPEGPCPTGFERVNGSCEGELEQGWEELGSREGAGRELALMPLGSPHSS